MNKQKIQSYLGWGLKVVLGLMFLAAGSGKFTAAAFWEPRFDGWGFPGGTNAVIGVLEILGAIALFVPKTSKMAAWGLIGIMAGALMTHVVHQEYGEIIRPLIFMALLFGVVGLGKRNKSA